MLTVHLAMTGDPATITIAAKASGDPFVEAMRELAGDIATFSHGPIDTMPERCEVLIGGGVDPEQLAAAEHLHTIIVPWAGIPEKLVESVAASERRDIAIRNIHHNAASSAEIAIGLLIAASRGIAILDRRLRSGDWRPRYEPRPTRRLDGSRATVLGRGAIGSRIARALTGLGMEVETLGRPPAGGRWEADQLVRRIEGGLVLIAAIPLLSETRGLINGQVLDAIPDGIFVNICRAEVVVEDDLYDRLSDGRLFAAGLDVWWRIPETIEEQMDHHPGNRPFQDLDNVVMTPKVGGGLGEPEIERRRAEEVAAILRELAT
jgi:phosphoglycerate dehydrogenase-like enzyme